MNDLIRLAMEQAVQENGSRDGEFTSRRFWEAFGPFAGFKPANGGGEGSPKIVRAMLTGRTDVELLLDGKYRLKP
jgi:hypothetical protein